MIVQSLIGLTQRIKKTFEIFLNAFFSHKPVKKNFSQQLYQWGQIHLFSTHTKIAISHTFFCISLDILLSHLSVEGDSVNVYKSHNVLIAFLKLNSFINVNFEKKEKKITRDY